jgi:membrane protein
MARRRVKEVLRQGFDSFRENDLLSYASAISFQMLFALVPSVLAAIALLGFLDLEEVWEQDLAPEVRERLEPDAYSVVDRLVSEILGERRGLWLTFGLAFSLWQVSGAVRATMSPLNAIYHDQEGRPFLRRFLVSFALAPSISLCLLFALGSIYFGPALRERLDLPGAVQALVFLGRWGVAIGLLLLAVTLLLHFGPAHSHSASWAGIGAIFVVGAWIVASLAFAAYATHIADYGSVYGSLASVIVLMTYLYLSAGAFLFGVQLDACIRTQAGQDDAAS